MTPKQTIETVYSAFSRGDIAFITSLVAPEAVWRQSKAVPWGGDYSGPDGAAEFFARINQSAETTGFVAHESVELGNDVFSFGNYQCTMRETGKPASMDWMFRWRIEDGKITLFDSYIDSGVILQALN